MNTDQELQSALKYYQEDNLQQTELVCRKILRKHPKNIGALHLLGIVFYRVNNYGSAIKYFKKEILFNQGDAGAYNNLGLALKGNGQHDEAIKYFQKALQLNPALAHAYYNLGDIHKEKGQIDEAITHYQKALQLDPNFTYAYFNLGTALQDKGRLDEALTCYMKTLHLDPNFVGAYNNLGIVLGNKRQLKEAVNYFQKALQLDPDLAETYNNLGFAQNELGRLDEAIVSYNAALALKPDFAEAHTNLGNVFKSQGKLIDAEGCYRRALRIKPDYLPAHSNLVLIMNYNSQYDAQTIFAEHLRFAKQHFGPSSAITHYTNDRSPDHRLRIGYVSPDFKRHSVAYFIEPVLSAHSRAQFEVFCYSNVSVADQVTRRIQESADQWRGIIGMSDGEAADLVRKDGIDILVDLAGHTAGNRISIFAGKPAPVQVNWIGYPATTGLSTMDYKIVDSYTDPIGLTDQFYTEKLMRLPGSFLCYLPDQDSPEAGELPVLTAGHMTFGSFNDLAKVSPEVIKLWTRLLKIIPDSRLIMKAQGLSDSMTRNYVSELFTREGLEKGRVELMPWEPSTKGHLGLYDRIDIGLDTFPYNGTTTTCEAIWMGVPVITLAGNTHASRVGVSLLSNIGLTELIAATHDEYLEIALGLAKDIRRLQTLRGRLRIMTARSSLTDVKQFIVDLERCYRIMWENWCKVI